MLRFAGAGLAAALTAALALAAETHGTVKKVDAEGGTFTVAVKMGKETTDKEFTVADSTKFVVHDGSDKREWTGKKALKDEAIHKGRGVAITTDADGKLLQVHVGAPLVWAHGTLKKADPEAGTVTVAVKGKKETTDKEFAVNDHTKVVVYDGKDRKELTGKAALKDEAVTSAKEGTEVAVATEGSKVVRVRIGPAPKKEEPKKEEK